MIKVRTKDIHELDHAITDPAKMRGFVYKAITVTCVIMSLCLTILTKVFFDASAAAALTCFFILSAIIYKVCKKALTESQPGKDPKYNNHAYTEIDESDQIALLYNTTYKDIEFLYEKNAFAIGHKIIPIDNIIFNKDKCYVQMVPRQYKEQFSINNHNYSTARDKDPEAYFLPLVIRGYDNCLVEVPSWSALLDDTPGASKFKGKHLFAYMLTEDTIKSIDAYNSAIKAKRQQYFKDIFSSHPSQPEKMYLNVSLGAIPHAEYVGENFRMKRIDCPYFWPEWDSFILDDEHVITKENLEEYNIKFSKVVGGKEYGETVVLFNRAAEEG
jgi:hypothetical protein